LLENYILVLLSVSLQVAPQTAEELTLKSNIIQQKVGLNDSAFSTSYLFANRLPPLQLCWARSSPGQLLSTTLI